MTTHQKYILSMGILIIVGLIALLFFLKTKHTEITEPINISQKKETPKDISQQAKSNALKNASAKDQNGNMIIADAKYIKEYQLVETADYQIAYQEPKNRYLLFITSKDFVPARKNAEDAFIRLIDLDKTKLCQLHVDVVTPSWANPAYAGKEYRLSFCE